MCTSAYVTHGDISRLLGLEEQTLIVVKAPEETKLEIPAPTEVSNRGQSRVREEQSCTSRIEG